MSRQRSDFRHNIWIILYLLCVVRFQHILGCCAENHIKSLKILNIEKKNNKKLLTALAQILAKVLRTSDLTYQYAVMLHSMHNNRTKCPKAKPQTTMWSFTVQKMS